MAVGFAVLLLLGLGAAMLPSIGAGLILHPLRRPVTTTAPAGCEAVDFKGENVNLKGWRGEAMGERRGTLVYLHGVADNRAGAAGVMQQFRKRGFDVIAYDSRAHGESGGNACTYGFFEKEDLRRVLDTVKPGPIVLVGSSLGGAVALQYAAGGDKRIAAVVSAESFSDIRSVVIERAPFFFSAGTIDRAFNLAEQKGKFRLNDVSPVLAAKSISAPSLIIHGALDSDTPPDHARRIFAALAGPKRLILVPNAKHNESLQGTMWQEIERWIDSVLTPSH